MAVLTSTQAGNISDSATWGGTGFNSGDRLVIGHAVVASASATVGDSRPSRPTTAGTQSAVGGGGSLPGGAYRVLYTYVDASGNESAVSGESSAFTLSAGDTLRVTFPALPTGVSSRKLYLTEAGGGVGTEKLYATGITTTTTDCTSASYTDGTTTYADAAVYPNGYAITLSGGSLTVNTGVTLTVRGDVQHGNFPVTFQAGSGLTFDASAAVSAANTFYAWALGTNNTQTGCDLTFAGTSGSRVTVQSNSGGGNGRFSLGYVQTGAWVDVGDIDADWVDFTRIGDATRDFCQWFPSAGGRSQTWDDCIMDACGTYRLSGSLRGSDVYAIRNCTWKNTAAGNPLVIRSNVALTTGTRLIRGCVFDKQLSFIDRLSFTIGGSSAGQWNLFYDGYAVVGSANAWASMTYNLVRVDSNDEQQACGSLSHCYFLADYVAINPHILGIVEPVAATIAIEDSIFEYTGTDDSGDCILHDGNAQTLEIRRCHFLPNSAGTGGSGTMFTMGEGIASQGVRNQQSTGVIGRLSTLAVNEAPSDPTQSLAGQVGYFRSNICWAPAGHGSSGIGPFKISDTLGTGLGMGSRTADIVAAANANYNCGWDHDAGFEGNGYNLNLTGTPGVNDVNEDPDFVDDGRRLSKRDTSLGGAGTVANALTELRKKNDRSGYNTAYTVNALLTYVRAGFAPQNPNLAGAAHDAGDIGAEAVLLSGGGGVQGSCCLLGAGR